ncbi:MAG TPA: hypothetical protein VJ836_06170 [Candidatus Saccharimonadales bacterium]|nr:hypothetical protein [Candidatus Saccharimonadales bacterium]
MMEIHLHALLIAILGYYGLSILILSLYRRATEVAQYSAGVYFGLFAESIAMTAGTAGIVSTLAYVPLGEALLATCALGFCYTVVTSLVHPASVSTPHPAVEKMTIGGYRFLGILSITFILYQWG